MPVKRTVSHHFSYTVFLGLFSACLVLSIILFPEKSFHASLQSLTVWWTIVFPIMLPFFIIAEIMLAYGILHFCGGLMEPVMRLLFRLPGMSGPVIAISLTIGYPFGAKITKQLYDHRSLSASESERLLTLSHIASPLLVINVISVGFLNHALYGVILYLIQLIAWLILGLMIRRSLPRQSATYHQRFITNAITYMRTARREDGRTFGKLLGDAVSSSINTLLMIGGYMMIFAVMVQVLIATPLTSLLYGSGQPAESVALSEALLKGIFEVHLGSYALSTLESHQLLWIMALLSAMLAWSGLSLHAQVSHIFAGSRLRFMYFVRTRLLQALLAFLLTFIIWLPLSKWLHIALPSFLNIIPVGNDVRHINLTAYYIAIPLSFTLLLLVLIAISVMLRALHVRVKR